MKWMKIIMIVSMALSLFGCSQNSNDTQNSQIDDNQNIILPEIDEDYFEVLTNHCDYSFYEDSVARYIVFKTISAKEYTADDLEVSFDQKVSFTYDFVCSENEISYELFSTYQGISWDKAIELHSSDKEFEYIYQYNDLYDNLENIPTLYEGQLAIAFDIDRSSDIDSLHQLNIKLNGQDYSYDIDHLSISHNNKMNDYSNFGYLSFQQLGRFEMNLNRSENNEYTLQNIVFYPADDLEITNIFFLESKNSIVSVYVTKIDSENITTNYQWDMQSPLAVNKGDEISLDITFKDENLNDQYIAYSNDTLYIEYTQDNQNFYDYMEFTYRLKMDEFEYYAMTYDQIDIMSYYNYLNAVIVSE